MRNIQTQWATCKWVACVLLTTGGIVTAYAAPPQDASRKTHHPPVQASHSTSKAKATFGPKVSASSLAKMSGGSDVTNRVKLNGSVTDTRTRHVVTGMNTVGGGSFSHAAGLPVVIQNSGNSVLIQNSMVVNLQLKQ